ncbi:MAG: FAD-dependent oxidoreductase [Betaproteobacteria bacterium]|nr:MAG: FAD-dependent oxidoreductase [Betaproteobacteria bacterium]
MKRLLLLGGGHAHVQVVRAFAGSPPADANVALMSTRWLTPYSGMLPGFIAGHYTHAQSHIDLAALCEAARVRFIEEEACAVDLARREVVGVSGGRHCYDLLCVDTGSTPPLDRVPGAAAHAIPIKPVDRFIDAIDGLTVRAHQLAGRTIAVVGAGAAGFEVVMALDYRIRSRIGRKPQPRLLLLTDARQILPEFPPRVRRLAERILDRQGIRVHVRAHAAEIDASGIRLANGARLDAEHVIFVTGAAAAPMYARSGLQTDARGFIAVNPGLQSLSHPEVFACGDIASMLDHPRPKAGVFAVRQGPALIRNLRRALAGEPPLPFHLQRHYLVLLSTGGKHAIATRNGWTVHGKWVWRWKDWIDRRFVGGFRPSADGSI